MTMIKKETRPIDFSIENQFQKSPALYILENPKKQKRQTEVHFTIKNTSEDQIFTFKEMHDLNKNNHQFALRFHSKVLDYEQPEDIQKAFSDDNINDGKWWVSPLNIDDCPGHEVLYFGHSNSGKLELKPGESLTIKARGLAAESKGGSRSTVVQLHCKFLEKVGTNNPNNNNYYHQPLDIYNHLGTSYAPIVAGMLGLDELLSTHRGDGAAKSQLSVKNDFSIFLTTSEPGEQLDFADNTQIELRFPYYAGSTYDEGVSTPTFVLGSKTEVAGIKITNETFKRKSAEIKEASKKTRKDIEEERDKDIEEEKKNAQDAITDAETTYDAKDKVIREEAQNKIAEAEAAFKKEEEEKKNGPGWGKIRGRINAEKVQKLINAEQTKIQKLRDARNKRKEQRMMAAKTRDANRIRIRREAQDKILEIDKEEREARQARQRGGGKTDNVSPPPLEEDMEITTGTLAYKISQVIDRPAANGKWGFRIIQLTLIEAIQLAFLRMDFTDLVVSGGNENSRIFLAVRNIPGYRDTELVLEVNKTNMVMKGHKTGIRTNDPQQALHIEGNALVDGQLLIGNPDKLAAAKEVFDEEYQNKDRDDSAIIFAPHQNYPDHAWIRFHSRSGAAHNLEIQVKQSEHGTDYLALQPQGGKVGIGTPEPTEALEVKGRVKDQTGYLMPVGSIIAYGGEDIPEGWLECNGQAIPEGEQYLELKGVLGGRNATDIPDLRSRFIVGLENRSVNDLKKDPLQGDAKFSLLHNSEGFPAIKKSEYLAEHGHSMGGIYKTVNIAPATTPTKVLVEAVPSAAKSVGSNGQPGLAPKSPPPYYVLRYIIKY